MVFELGRRGREAFSIHPSIMSSSSPAKGIL
jgi:hypothetical protein